MRINKYILWLLTPLLFLPKIVYAHCPLCTGAVVAGAVGAKYLGLDASLVGVFAGGAAISLGLWTAKLLKKKYIPLQSILIIIAVFLLTVVPAKAAVSDSMYLPVHLFGHIGSIFNTVYFVNKILLGSLMGGLVALLAYWSHLTIKKIKGKVLFPFQGIVLTVLSLIIAAIAVQLTLV